MFEKVTIGVVIALIAYMAFEKNKDVSSEMDVRYEAVMSKYDMSLSEAKAYGDCKSQIWDKHFTPRAGVSMSKIPAEVCLCQARTMAKHFKEGQNSSHEDVVDYVANKPGSNRRVPIYLAHADLLKPTDTKTQFLTLAKSLNQCARDAAQDINDATKKRLKGLCASEQLDAKKCSDLRKRGQF